MKVPNWLYFVLVIGGTGGLTLLLSFLFFNALRGFMSPDFDIFLILLAPFFISLSTAYAILSRRYTTPAQRRLLNSILVTFTGIIMLLSGTGVYFSSFYYDSAAALIGLLGFVVMLYGFSLALPESKYKGVLISDPTHAEHLNPKVERSGYLPVAGVATLIATILTSLVTFLSVPTAIGECYSIPATCIPPTMTVLGIFSILGVITGIAATSSLLKGRYRRTVPLGLIFLTTSPLLILVVWDYWFLLALPILALCVASTALTAWDQKDSMRASDWKAIALLSASLGAIALVAGVLQFPSNHNNVCPGVSTSPYLNNAGLLLSLAAAGITFAMISMDSARMNSVNPRGFLPARNKTEKRSMLFQVSILLFTASLASTTLFSAALIAPSLNQCNFSCPTRVEQLNISQVTFGPSGNQVTFTLYNSGTSDVTISASRFQGPGTSNFTYASQLSESTICAGSSAVLLIATFPGVTFVKGTTYSFQLVSSNGNYFPFSVTA